MSVVKAWTLSESQGLRFARDIFNRTNAVRVGVGMVKSIPTLWNYPGRFYVDADQAARVAIQLAQQLLKQECLAGHLAGDDENKIALSGGRGLCFGIFVCFHGSLRLGAAQDS